MPKRHPEERWRDYVLEGYRALVASNEFKQLRRRGLKAIGRARLLADHEWGEILQSGLTGLPGYQSFREGCAVLAKRYGLAQWTVEAACLVSRHRPEKSMLVVEGDSPLVRVVTNSKDELFLRHLALEAHRLGLHVRQRTGDTESTLVLAGVPETQDERLLAAHRPPRDCAFRLRVETPPLYPPEAAAELHRRAQQAERELLRRLGYAVPERLRHSEVAAAPKRLRVRKEHLESAETAEIADKIYGGYAGDDPSLRNRIRRNRSRLKRRLEGRYEGETD